MLVRFSRLVVALACIAVAFPNVASSGTIPAPATSTVAVPRAGANSHRETRRPHATTGGCTTAGNGSSEGPGPSDVAGGKYSAVVNGDSNEACDYSSAVVAGNSNIIYGNGDLNAEASLIGAGAGNEISQYYAFDGAGADNTNDALGAFIGTGRRNAIGTNAQLSFIGAGEQNDIGGLYSFVGSGVGNNVGGTGSFVGAGGFNTTGNVVSGTDSFVGSGDANTVGASNGVIGGGANNTLTSAATYGTVSGGYGNSVSATYAGIAGGGSNKAEGAFSMIPGGADNEALGAASFAAGYHAKASHSGSFVWSDDVSNSGYATDGNSNEFVVRASGGTYFFSNEGETVGVKLASGSGAWASTSDRNAKTDIAALDDASILAKVAALPIDSWRYKTEAGVRHLGPMAQDFYAAFRVGEDDTHITSIDEDGVALVAIKALHTNFERAQLRDRRANADLRATIAAQQGEIVALRAEMQRLERRVAATRSR